MHSELLQDLLKINVFKVGEFTLKTGGVSPIYIDLRCIIGYPNIVKKVAEAIKCKLDELNLQVDSVCGVPYTSLPTASVFSVLFNIPMILQRKESKNYGTKKMVEGVIVQGHRCLIIEDVVVSGSSIIESAHILRNEGLTVTDCIAVLDRKQGGRENLAKEGINFHTLFDVNDMFKKFCSLNEVTDSLVARVNQYLDQNSYVPVNQSQCSVRPVETALGEGLGNMNGCSFRTFHQRATTCSQPVARRLFDTISLKKSNLCVAIDVTSSEKLLQLADDIGPHICILKTHIDILTDFSQKVITSLREIAAKCNFLLMEDRKFADIGNTVVRQYADGMYKIQEWADIVTVHGIPGNGVLDGLISVVGDKPRACVLVADMSCKDALTDENYKKSIIKLANRSPDFVIGFISQKSLCKAGHFIHMCPGVSMTAKCDTFSQSYKSPEAAVENGADIIIVGRGIYESTNPVKEAELYKTKAYNAYINKMH